MLCDKELGKLLREWQVRPTTPPSTSTRTTPIPEDLDRRIQELVDGLPMLRSDTEDEDSVAHVRAVIESQIQRLIDHDPNNSAKYQQLIQKINPPVQQQLQPVVAFPGARAQSSNEHEHEHDQNSGKDLSLADFEARYASLSNKERDCLTFFSWLPEGFVVNKTEIFYWLRSIFLIYTTEERDSLLAKLTVKGFIARVTPNKGFSYYYMMQTNVHSWVLQKKDETDEYRAIVDAQEHGFRFLHRWPTSAVTNVNNKILNSDTTFNYINENIKYRIAAKLILGSQRRMPTDYFNNYMDEYIVVDEESLHNYFLKLTYKLRILSLRGTSGIVHFPDSVSNLQFLEFLDLSACNNLESLPKGIGSLRYLEYLDLSECYLLGYIPIEIASVPYLTVLKGFIINSDPHVLERRTERKWWKKKVDAPGSSSFSCPFNALSNLQFLEKLTIRTKRMDFPKNEDLNTLCNLSELSILGITWVGSPNTAQINGTLQEFPYKVMKLVLQSAPHQTASQLLELIGKRKHHSRLNKLYIRGGDFREFNPEKHCFPNVKIVRLRYLHQLKVEWDQFKVSFPNLTWLEVFRCPNLTSFPCDSNGMWKK